VTKRTVFYFNFPVITFLYICCPTKESSADSQSSIK